MSKQVLHFPCVKIGFELVFLQSFVSVFRSLASASVLSKH